MPFVLRFCDGVFVERANRQTDADGRASTDGAFGFNAAAMQFNNVLYNRQSQTRATQFAAARFVRAIKALKNSRQIAARNSDALVADADADLVTLTGGLHHDFAFGLRIFHCVVEQIVNHFLQAILVRE